MKTNLHQFKIKNHHLIAMHWSLMEILKNDIKTPYSPELILATMEFLAHKQKRSKNKSFVIMVEPKVSQMIWGCTKTALDHELVPNIDQLDTFYDVLAMLSYELDKK